MTKDWDRIEETLSYGFMWEILVPTTMMGTVGPIVFSVEHHREWDDKVRQMSGGLTIMHPVEGQWISPDNSLLRERMIPVRVIANRLQISGVIDLTLRHYKQQAILCYKISDEVIMRYAKPYAIR